MDQKYWILIAFWVFYFIIHSLTASALFKRFFTRIGVSQTSYRKIYVIFFTIGLMALLTFGSTLSEGYLLEPGRVLKFTGLVLAASGIIVIRLAFKQYRLREFLGFSKENPAKKLERNGILSYIRHPIYLGTILIILGFLFYIPKLSSLIITLIAFLYLIVGIYIEEKKLIKEFGAQYIDYKKRVPALVPKLKDIISI